MMRGMRENATNFGPRMVMKTGEHETQWQSQLAEMVASPTVFLVRHSHSVARPKDAIPTQRNIHHKKKPATGEKRVQNHGFREFHAVDLAKTTRKTHLQRR
jgi:hypothetical protein